MAIKFIIGAVCTCLTVVSFNVSAIITNTHNGIDYEWLELTQTANMSRIDVQTAIDTATVGSTLYGYEYASRELVEDLLLSYAPWDGNTGWHSNSAVIIGMTNYFQDFGLYRPPTFDGITETTVTVEGVTVTHDDLMITSALYGLEAECYGIFGYTCVSTLAVGFELPGVATMAWQGANDGFDSSTVGQFADRASSFFREQGSLLVRRSASVPEPSVAILLATGLIVFRVARRKVRS